MRPATYYQMAKQSSSVCGEKREREKEMEKERETGGKEGQSTNLAKS